MSAAPVVFLLDVDNTLLDNDRIVADLHAFLVAEEGPDGPRRYFAHFEALRAELGYSDYLGALQRLRHERPHDPHLLPIAFFLLDYPFADRVYPEAFAVLAHLARRGPVALLTDGDVVFQPRKLARSGLLDAVAGRALITVHKETELDEVERRWPAAHWVMVDDKLRLLTAIKAHWGARVTTVFPRQGQYAHDADVLARYPAADATIARIGDLLGLDLPEC